MTETQTCPRRLNEPGPWERKEDLDTWGTRPPIGMPVLDPEPVCSFCGSLHPERFLELAGEGWVVEPTTKSYKAYLAEVLQGEPILATPEGPMPAVANRRAKFYFQHLDEAQMRRFVDLYNTNVMRIGLPGYFEVLPFFMKIGQPSREP